MTKKSFFIIPLFVLFLISCNCENKQDKINKSKQEILNTEKEFEACVRNEGLAVGFHNFADDKAVINRNDTLIIGKITIKEVYDKKKNKDVQLSWNADFVDVSESCDLGYTYGNYIYTIKDSTGKIKEYKGIFHTVWKKQSDGTWKYVWD